MQTTSTGPSGVAALHQQPLPLTSKLVLPRRFYRRCCSQRKRLVATEVVAQGFGGQWVMPQQHGWAAGPHIEGVSLGVGQPHYEVRFSYQAAGRALDGASAVWAHCGHSGWQHTKDVPLTRQEGDGQVWSGSCQVPAGQLPAAWHLDLQVVFKGRFEGGAGGGCERWDNNSGRNWSIEVELSAGMEGLVTSPNPPRNMLSSLLLRIEFLVAARKLSLEQGSLLRSLAWQRDFSILHTYEQVRYQDDATVAGALQQRCGFLRRPGLHVVHVASEMAPIAKVGGLADVVTALAKAHLASGTLSEVVLPKYDCIDYSRVDELREMMTVQVRWDGQDVPTTVWSCIVDGLPVYLIEPQRGAGASCSGAGSTGPFWRGAFYGQSDDADRFLLFSRAACEFLLQAGKQPDVLHIHDWQCAAVAPLLAVEYRARGLARTGTVLTIHNIAFQGWATPDYLDKVGLPRDQVYHPWAMLDDSRPGFLHGQHDINLLKGAVVYADRVTTVSPTYAREVFDPGFGMGMQGVLEQQSHKFSGVLNGIDYETWCPETDALIPTRFSAENLAGKESCKQALCAEIGLPYNDAALHPRNRGGSGGGSEWLGPSSRPLLAIVSRLTEQKGLPLIRTGIEAAVQGGAQVVLLGTASDPSVTQEFEVLAAQLGQGPDARLLLRFDEALSHRIYAGADMILIPSFFEPCGLTQLISLRYGTIPIVRQTGGLADTVRDVADTNIPEHERNGFVFQGKDVGDVQHAVRRATDAYYDGHAWWRGDLVPRSMRQDWSWSRSAQDYLDLYRTFAHGRE